ncbi:MAG: D-tyrosyl-tRNA(Tyr) deacylase [Clostridia bacterium]|nr:D-tyrosyl-tRNA(Tyr) deacylase [Clostridia bacterium]
MKAVIQRVITASVSINDEQKAQIEKGLVVLLGVGKQDTTAEAELLARKIAALRIFSDENDKMNLSVKDVGGSLLVISNFTLYADTKKGTRPSFDPAMPPKKAKELYEYFCTALAKEGVPFFTGEFGADMQVSLVNDGPVTVILDTGVWRK